MTETAFVQLTILDLYTILESGTIDTESALYKRLRAARDAFYVKPKVYGANLKLVPQQD